MVLLVSTLSLSTCFSCDPEKNKEVKERKINYIFVYLWNLRGWKDKSHLDSED